MDVGETHIPISPIVVTVLVLCVVHVNCLLRHIYVDLVSRVARLHQTGAPHFSLHRLPVVLLALHVGRLVQKLTRLVVD